VIQFVAKDNKKIQNDKRVGGYIFTPKKKYVRTSTIEVHTYREGRKVMSFNNVE